MSGGGIDQASRRCIHLRRLGTRDHKFHREFIIDLQILQLTVGTDDGSLISTCHQCDSIWLDACKDIRIDIRVRNQHDPGIFRKMFQSRKSRFIETGD